MFLPVFIPILAWALWLLFGKRKVRTHRVAILATAIPPTLLIIAWVVLLLLDPALAEEEGSIGFICGIVSLCLATAAFLSSVVFAIRRRWEIVKGTGFGSGIGWVAFLIAFGVGSVLYG